MLGLKYTPRLLVTDLILCLVPSFDLILFFQAKVDYSTKHKFSRIWCRALQTSAPVFHLSCAPGSCPNLMMSRNEQADTRPVPMALTPQLPPRAHRPLCLSVSSDSNGRFKALETQEWKNNLKAQVRLHTCCRESGARQRDDSSLRVPQIISKKKNKKHKHK